MADASAAIADETVETSTHGVYSAVDAVLVNLSNMKTVFPIAAVLIALVVFTVIVIRFHATSLNVPAALAILVVCCFPFVWYIAFKTHSYVHNFFTYRELSITVFGVLALLYVHLDFSRKRQLPEVR